MNYNVGYYWPTFQKFSVICPDHRLYIFSLMLVNPNVSVFLDFPLGIAAFMEFAQVFQKTRKMFAPNQAF